jgi:hypothetical protein
MPEISALPKPLRVFFLDEPEEEQDTSYLALSVRIFNFTASIFLPLSFVTLL